MADLGRLRADASGPFCVHVARGLIAESSRSATAGGGVARVLDAVCTRVHGRLGPWIGADGCATLFRHAFTACSAHHPEFGWVSVREAPPHLDGLERLEALGPGLAVEAVECALVALVDHFSRLVGDGVAVRLLLPETPALWGGRAHEGDG